jgi:hypothetical protein
MTNHRMQTALLLCATGGLILACNRQPAPAIVTDFAPLAAGPALAKGGACGIDVVAGMNRDLPKLEVVAGTATVEFNGWAALDVASAAVGGEVALVLRGERSYTIAAQRVSRDDVATYFKQPGMANAGYRVRAKMQGVAVGKYQLQLHIAQKQGAPIVCQPLATALEVISA